ncbi:tripartite tricarboxylate transporter TctB family protein [Salinisphaera sp. T31B1]|uniref:tripartite tricarboxylate transporter TctB family protein n=1 Tax=Salinisphaera sp. T31B1 TaxID=727963 RepID=UPI0033406B53
MTIRKLHISAGLWGAVIGLLLIFWLIPEYISVPPAAKFTPGPTPRTFPTILAWALVVSGIGSMIIDMLARPVAQTAPAYRLDWKTALLIAGLIALYVLLFHWAGFTVTTVIVLFGFLWLLSPLGVLPAAGVSVAVTLIIVALFSTLLQIPLPESFPALGL